MKKIFCTVLTLLILFASACAPVSEQDAIVIGPAPAQVTSCPKEAFASEPPASPAPGTEPPAETPGVTETPGATEVSSPEPTEIPTEAPTPTPTEAPPTPTNAEEAAALYSYRPVDIPYIERATLVSDADTVPARFYMDSDGVYRQTVPGDSDEIVIYFTGDLMCQSRQQVAAETMNGYDFNESFDYVRDIFSGGDLVIGGLEGCFTEKAPYMSEQNRVEDSFNLNAPSTFVQAVRNANFDMVLMCNNHNLDTDIRGIYETIDRVEDYGLMHTGLYKNGDEERTALVEVNGVLLGFLNYGTFFNRKEWHLNDLGLSSLLNVYSKERLERDMAHLRERGAQYVFVCMHWGIEYADSPSITRNVPALIRGAEDRGIEIPVLLDYQLKWAQEIADAGADYIVGSHTHSIQKYSVVKSADGRNVPVIYSMGNFISHQKKEGTQDTLILRVTLSKNGGSPKLKGDAYIPVKMFEAFMGKNYVPMPVVKPYRGDIESKSFASAYTRIVRAVGWQINVLGWL